jgi:predicted RNA binding protein YcfA (HicA-like mRNA interferase family)
MSPKLPVITIPNHKELKPGLLRSILHDAMLSVEEFFDLL